MVETQKYCRTDPLQGNDREIRCYKTAVAK
jgi:hypothetical protein